MLIRWWPELKKRWQTQTQKQVNKNRTLTALCYKSSHDSVPLTQPKKVRCGTPSSERSGGVPPHPQQGQVGSPP